MLCIILSFYQLIQLLGELNGDIIQLIQLQHLWIQFLKLQLPQWLDLFVDLLHEIPGLVGQFQCILGVVEEYQIVLKLFNGCYIMS